MNRFFCYTLLLAIVLIGCHKDDDNNGTPPPIEKKCEVASQNGFDYLVDNFYGAGFNKTFSADGKVSELMAISFTGYGCIDTFYYSLRYMDDENVRINMSKFTAYCGSDIPRTLDRTDSIDVKLNSKGYAIQTTDYSTIPAEIIRFTYDANDRLDSVGGLQFRYDDKGNLIKILQTDSSSSLFWNVEYTYDYSKETNNQVYITTGFWYYPDYNLMQTLGWIPPLHKNLCTSQRFYNWDSSFDDTFGISNHVIDNNGNLTSFEIMVTDLGESKTITNAVVCEN